MICCVTTIEMPRLKQQANLAAISLDRLAFSVSRCTHELGAADVQIDFTLFHLNKTQILTDRQQTDVGELNTETEFSYITILTHAE